jgi:NADH:ubiquinone oxidoreductase subunit F (NADH-binding)
MTVAGPAQAFGPAPRLLAGLPAEGAIDAATHLAQHGPLPARTVARGPDEALIRTVEASGLLGRGGAGFPTGRKLRTVAAGKRPVVVANGAEGEPASRKDALLLTRTPHLVLDGIEIAARAVGSTHTHLVLHQNSPALAAIRGALLDRPPTGLRLHELPPRYVASESSALVQWINGGDARPTFSPPRTYERGVDGRPTLVNNVETLAHLAMIARSGPQWYREVGDPDEPGTLLVTVSLPRGGRVFEVPSGSLVGDVLGASGVSPSSCAAVLVGGYFGTWMSREQVWSLPLSHYAMRAAGGALGAGILIPLPRDGACGLAETARVIGYLAAENAGQCGPCLNGLPAIAAALHRIAFEGATEHGLSRWLSVVPGRGACSHPDGATRMVASALATFAGELETHLTTGPCPAAVARTQLLPVPSSLPTPSGWR